jgi:hypothetical protein
MMPPASMADLPDGRYAVIDEDGVLRLS